MKPIKICPHANTVQVGNPGIIETFCSDCNEKIKVEIFRLPYNSVDSHGDIILKCAFDKSINQGKFNILNHKPND
jgi:hypothetical protein